MDLKDLQLKVDNWIKNYGVRYFNELTNLAILTEEVGELARLMSRKFGEQSFKKHKTEKEIGTLLEEELADILFVITCLANQMDIDLESAITNNLIKKTDRDNNRHKQNIKLK